MKKLLVLSMSVVSFAVSAQMVAQEEWARVKSAEPIYGQAYARPHQECTTQYVERRVRRAPETPRNSGNGVNIGAAILGTLGGGIIGNQFGQGTGKDVATAVGAGVGAILGSRMDQPNNEQPSYPGPLYGQTESVPVQNCSTVTDMQPAPVVGYRIVLDYNGKDMVYQSTVAPRGDYVRVRVQITPIM